MRIQEHFETDLTDEDQKAFCMNALSVCQKYPLSVQDGWVAAVLLYLLDTYLRISTTIDECGRDTSEGRAWVFALAHERPPVLPAYLMNIAARAMR